MQVNVLEAKTNLSNLIKPVESGREESIIIARHGKLIVKMVVHSDVPATKRIGVAKGRPETPVEPDADNETIGAMFEGAL